MNIITRDYQGHAVIFNDAGWINATELAAKHGKRVDAWLKTQDTNDYIAALCEMIYTTVWWYVKTSKATLANGGGTWLHPKLAVAFARWLDPRFAIWCDTQIDSLIRGKDVRNAVGKATQSFHFANEHRLINSLLSGEYKALEREANAIPDPGPQRVAIQTGSGL